MYPRTIVVDFWASLDYQMQGIRDKIDKAKE